MGRTVFAHRRPSPSWFYRQPEYILLNLTSLALLKKGHGDKINEDE